VFLLCRRDTELHRPGATPPLHPDMPLTWLPQEVLRRLPPGTLEEFGQSRFVGVATRWSTAGCLTPRAARRVNLAGGDRAS
jgi:hypothetical protein